MTQPFDLSQTDELLATTRAVRRRLDLDRAVERAVLLDCLRLSQQAPTGSNSQTWRWLVVTDPDKRKTIADVYKEGGTTYLEQARANLSEGDAQTKRVYDSAFWLMDHMHEVPALVIPCVVGRLPDGAPNIMAASVYGSIFPAMLWHALNNGFVLLMGRAGFPLEQLDGWMYALSAAILLCALWLLKRWSGSRGAAGRRCASFRRVWFSGSAWPRPSRTNWTRRRWRSKCARTRSRPWPEPSARGSGARSDTRG